MSEPRAVVITGVGMVCPLGATTGETVVSWSSGVELRTRRFPEFAGTCLESAEAAVLPEFDPVERTGAKRMLKFMAPAAVLGAVAAREALEESQAKARYPGERIGLYAGTGLASASIDDVRGMIERSLDDQGNFSERLLGARGLGAANPLLSFKILANMPACFLSVIHGIKGANLIFTPWEGQTGAALQEAWRAVGCGEVDCALAGAADQAANPATLAYLRHAGFLGAGEIPSSAAAYVVLEARDAALRDSRPIHAVVSRIDVRSSDGPVRDPLASRLGRTFAAAPALLLALQAALAATGCFSVQGVDGQCVELALEASAP